MTTGARYAESYAMLVATALNTPVVVVVVGAAEPVSPVAGERQMRTYVVVLGHQIRSDELDQAAHTLDLVFVSGLP